MKPPTTKSFLVNTERPGKFDRAVIKEVRRILIKEILSISHQIVRQHAEIRYLETTLEKDRNTIIRILDVLDAAAEPGESKLWKEIQRRRDIIDGESEPAGTDMEITGDEIPRINYEQLSSLLDCFDPALPEGFKKTLIRVLEDLQSVVKERG